MSKKLITHKDLLDLRYFGGRNTIYKYLRQEDCPSKKIKGKWYVDLGKFKRWYKKKIIEKKKKKRR